MCLSTVYKNTLTPEAIMMRNVMRIECKDGMVILTDLMERQMAVEGTLEMANLVDGVAVVKEAAVHHFRRRMAGGSLQAGEDGVALTELLHSGFHRHLLYL